MKTLFRLFTLLFPLLFSQQVFSQLVLGAKFTANHNWQKYDNRPNPANDDLSVWGIGFSGSVLYPINNHFKVGLEPGMVQRGTKCLPNYPVPYGGDAKIVCNYVEMPIVVETSWKAWEDRILFFGKIGGGVSRAVGGYIEISSWNPEVPVKRNDLIPKDEAWMRKWDKGIQGSLGLGVKAGPGYISLETRYYHALNDFSKRATSKNRSMGYSLGYRISI